MSNIMIYQIITIISLSSKYLYLIYSYIMNMMIILYMHICVKCWGNIHVLCVVCIIIVRMYIVNIWNMGICFVRFLEVNAICKNVSCLVQSQGHMWKCSFSCYGRGCQWMCGNVSRMSVLEIGPVVLKRRLMGLLFNLQIKKNGLSRSQESLFWNYQIQHHQDLS